MNTIGFIPIMTFFGIGILFLAGLYIPVLGDSVYGRLNPARIRLPALKRLATLRAGGLASVYFLLGFGMLVGFGLPPTVQHPLLVLVPAFVVLGLVLYWTYRLYKMLRSYKE